MRHDLVDLRKVNSVLSINCIFVCLSVLKLLVNNCTGTVIDKDANASTAMLMLCGITRNNIDVMTVSCVLMVSFSVPSRVIKLRMDSIFLRSSSVSVTSLPFSSGRLLWDQEWVVSLRLYPPVLNDF